MPRVYLTPYGVGLGHASRLVTIAKNINLENHNIKIRFSSFGESSKYIRKSGYDCVDVPPIDFSWNDIGSFSFKNTISNIPTWFINFTKQINIELKSMMNFSPKIIVSDSRLSSIIAGKILNIPSIVLINQIKLLFSPRIHGYKLAKIYEKINGEFIGMLWSLADKILVPDLPPPYTISEQNTWGINLANKKIHFIGFATKKGKIKTERIKKVTKGLALNENKKTIFFHISGPTQTRIHMIKKIRSLAKTIDNDYNYIISEGNPLGKTEPERINNSGIIYEWCPIRDELFEISDIIVLRGGHTALSQAIQYGKPIISIPIENHAEQIGNSKKIEKIGIGLSLEMKDITSETMEIAIKKIINEPSFQARSLELVKISEKSNGIENIMNIIRPYVY